MASEADLFTQFVRPLEYAAIVSRNRDAFLLNYSKDFGAFDKLFCDLQNIWLRVARERDQENKSHIGLYLHASLLIRHSLFAFHALTSYQSFLAWLTFRPGLEALLIIGKWADDPKNAEVWKNHEGNRRKYKEVFEGKSLISRSLLNSNDFRQVLTRINDGFLHPNPAFGYRETRLSQASSETLVLETPLFDRERDLHEAHLLAFLHLFATVVENSDLLLDQLLGSLKENHSPVAIFTSQNADRARTLADENPVARDVLEKLGLWSFQGVSGAQM